MTDNNKCERAAELVTYFYGEADEGARQSFEQHLGACAACRDELAAFGHVRAAVGEWRAELIERAPALTLAAVLPDAARNGRPHRAQETTAAAPRSAWAALREFFTLTPAWARVGMVAASLVVCALAALAVARAQFRWDDHGIAFGWGNQANAPQSIAPQPAPQATVADVRYTQAQIDKLAAERDAAQRELAAARAQLGAAQQQVAALNVNLTTLRTQHQTTLANLRTARGNQANAARRGGAQGMFVADNQDEDGLRLSDLLTEVSAGRTPPEVKHNDR